MENIYKILSFVFIIVTTLLIIGVASYVTERSGLSGIMGQTIESKGTKKLTKEEIIQKWTSLLAYIFIFLSILLSIISNQIQR